MKKIILWSSSPRRKEIFTILWIPFEVQISDYEEDMSLQKTMSPTKLALLLSQWKGESLVKSLDESAIVVAADTFIIYDNKCLWKPFTPEKNTEMLLEFSWKTLQVITWYYIHDMFDSRIFTWHVVSDVTMKNYTHEQVKEYVNSWEWLDKAWWFAVQLKWNLLIDSVHWDWYNIMWLPLSTIYEKLQICWISC